MKKLFQIKKIYFTGILLLVFLNSYCEEWDIQSFSIKFQIKNFGSEVEGTFSSMNSIIIFDPNDLTSSFVQADIDIFSINTGNKTRDKHLKGKEYFDEASFKKIVFKSDKIIPTSGKDKYIVNGRLSIKGITKEISFPFLFVQDGTKGNFKGSFTLNRLDYNVGASSWILDEQVNVTIEVRTNKK